MAEPTISLQINEGTEGVPSWANIVTGLVWTGPNASAGSLSDALIAPISDSDNVFYDNAASPNNGELWHDAGTDVQIVTAGRNTNRNILRALETGGSDGTVDPPELTAYDDSTDGAARTAPTVWVLAGTTGSSNVSCIRAIETTTGAPGAGWTGQVHDAAPSAGNPLAGNVTNKKVVCATALAASGNKTFNLAAALPHDATSGSSSFIYQFQYTYV